VEAYKDETLIGNYCPSEYESAFAGAIESVFGKKLSSARIDANGSLKRILPPRIFGEKAVLLRYTRFNPLNVNNRDLLIETVLTRSSPDYLEKLKPEFPTIFSKNIFYDKSLSNDQLDYIAEEEEEAYKFLNQLYDFGLERNNLVRPDNLKAKFLAVTDAKFLLPECPITQWNESFDFALARKEDLPKNLRSFVIDGVGGIGKDMDNFTEVYFSIYRSLRIYNPPWEKTQLDPLEKSLKVYVPRVVNQLDKAQSTAFGGWDKETQYIADGFKTGETTSGIPQFSYFNGQEPNIILYHTKNVSELMSQAVSFTKELAYFFS